MKIPFRKLTWNLRIDRWKTILLYNPVGVPVFSREMNGVSLVLLLVTLSLRYAPCRPFAVPKKASLQGSTTCPGACSTMLAQTFQWETQEYSKRFMLVWLRMTNSSLVLERRMRPKHQDARN